MSPLRSAFLLIMLSLLGCKKHFKLYYSTTDDLNSLSGPRTGQPVMVGLYPLTHLPEGLGEASCDTFTSAANVGNLVKNDQAREPTMVSLTADNRDILKVPRARSARWMLIVPFWEQKCGAESTAWALVRLTPLTRRRAIDLAATRLSLPWDEAGAPRPHRRQRGCVDGHAQHAQYSICE